MRRSHQDLIKAAARWYIKTWGFAVLPVEGKVPLTKNGSKDATKSVRVAERWFTNYPSGNVAVATGNVSGLWVLDIDGPEGISSMKSLISEHGREWCDVPTVRTGKGGYHLYFSGTDDYANCAKRLPGIDARGRGGYVVAPPSIHPDTGRAYKWVRNPRDRGFCTPPDWLMESLYCSNVGKATSVQAKDWSSIVGVCETGSRNTTLTQITGAIVRGIKDNDLARALVHAYNETFLDPPLDDEEEQTIWESILGKEMAASSQISRSHRAN